MFFRRRHKGIEITPDEIFLDSKNISQFDEQQFEGVLEQPLSGSVFRWFVVVVVLVIVIFSSQLVRLQLVRGEEYLERSENNRIHRVPIFAQRGVIYDRNGELLAWNSDADDTDEPFTHRSYIEAPGFGHVLGYVSYPQKDPNGFYWRDALEGREGVELDFDAVLRGRQGAELIETDAALNVLSKEGLLAPEDGTSIALTVDAEMQAALHEGIAQMIEQFGYQAGAGIVMNAQSGELRVLTSAPEFDPTVVSEGEDDDLVQEYLTSPRGYFLNRAVSGLYTPGSIVKPFMALAALEEGVIDAQTQIESVGRIEIPNPYNPDNPSIFRDWRTGGHGMTDVKWALADSVNTFFYAISGGYRGQEGIGIDAINKYMNLFGLGQPTGSDLRGEVRGVIPNPRWKQKVFDDEWRLGDTYITSIGQFGFQVTPLQMARSIATIANNGRVVIPHLVAGHGKASQKLAHTIDPEHYQLVREGMRDTVTKGTAQTLNIGTWSAAAKTGTAQVGTQREFVNSWVVGFYPYDEPENVFVVVMEKGPAQDTVGASWAVRYMFDRLDGRI